MKEIIIVAVIRIASHDNNELLNPQIAIGACNEL
jgi:hypothetical protein